MIGTLRVGLALDVERRLPVGEDVDVKGSELWEGGVETARLKSDRVGEAIPKGKVARSGVRVTMGGGVDRRNSKLGEAMLKLGRVASSITMGGRETGLALARRPLVL